MNNKKKLIGLLAGLACVVLCVVLLLTTCSGDRNGSGADNTEEATLAAETEAPTAAVEETEEPTEATEATEEATEPTEEATEPTQPAGNSRPGGTSGFTGSTTENSGTGDNTESDDTEEPDEEEIVVDAPGTQNVAYTEYLGQIPDAYSSVQIPAGDSIYYNIYNADGVVLTIEDADAYVIYEGVTYGADGNGKIRVRLASADADTPASLRIGNASAEVEAYTMDFAAPMGSELNPEILENVETITVTLDEDHPDGYYYSWTAEFDSTLVLSVKSITPVEAECDLTVTVGGNTVSLADSADGTVSIDVPEGEEAVIRVAAKSEAAAEIVINGVAKGEPGSVHNPYEIHAQDQLSTETVLIPAGSSVYYNVYEAGGMVLTIADPDAYVVYDNVTYGADGDGAASVRIKAGEAGVPALLTIGNSGAAEEAYAVSFAYPQGGADHAETLESLGTVTATVSSEYDGTYYNWTADSTGVLVLRVQSMTNLTEAAEVSCDVTITNLTQGTTATLSADGWTDGSGYSTVSGLVQTGDQVQIVAAARNSGTIAELVMETAVCGTEESKFLVSGELVRIPAASWLEIYASANSGGRILTIRDAADLTLYVNGTQYVADANGVITLTMPETQNEMLLVTASTASKVYTMEFTYPLGSFENPGQLPLGESVVNVPAGSGDGFYCAWTADNEGKLIVTVDQANAELASITLTNQSTNATITDMVQNADGTFSITADVGTGQTILLNAAAKDASHPAVAVAMNVAFNASAVSDNQTPTEAQTEETTGQTVEEVSPAALPPEALKGTEENPEKVASIEEIQVKLEAESAGCYYSWTAAENGTLTFKPDEEQKLEGLRANIILINQRTKEEAELWLFENGKFTEQEAVSIQARAGDEILILVTVTVPGDTYVEREDVVCVAAEWKVCGCFEAEAAAAELVQQVQELQQIPEIKPGPEAIAQADAPVAAETEPESIPEETAAPEAAETE